MDGCDLDISPSSSLQLYAAPEHYHLLLLVEREKRAREGEREEIYSKFYEGEKREDDGMLLIIQLLVNYNLVRLHYKQNIKQTSTSDRLSSYHLQQRVKLNDDKRGKINIINKEMRRKINKVKKCVIMSDSIDFDPSAWRTLSVAVNTNCRKKEGGKE